MIEAIKIEEGIYYYPPVDEPLSANVVCIDGKDYLWLYDVGNNYEIVDKINAIDKKKKIILSHFHPDHTANISKIQYDDIYQGQFTFNHTKVGTVIQNIKVFKDGEKECTIMPFPSSHAKGSIAVMVNNKYLFVGDGTYTARKAEGYYYNAGIVLEQIRLLRSISAEYVFQSHREPFGVDKKILIEELEEIYKLRNTDEPYIYLDKKI